MINFKFPLVFDIEIDLGDGRKLVQKSDKTVYVKNPPSFEGDSLVTYNKNMSWLTEPRFVEAYARGIRSGHRYGNVQLQWRVHVCIWAALNGLGLEGDFVECGVHTGIFSLAVMHYLDFNRVDKDFYLFDTFNGIPEELLGELTAEELAFRGNEPNAKYFDSYAQALRNFALFKRARLVRGKVPESLAQADIGKVAYLSIDMNVASPEIAAGEFFWDRLVPGAVVVLDDYGWRGHDSQKQAWDEFAARKKVPILCLPTGQGLILKGAG